MLISRRREAKRRALLQLLDRIPVRAGSRLPRLRALVAPLPEVPLAASAPSSEAPPRIKQ